MSEQTVDIIRSKPRTVLWCVVALAGVVAALLLWNVGHPIWACIVGFLLGFLGLNRAVASGNAKCLKCGREFARDAVMSKFLDCPQCKTWYRSERRSLILVGPDCIADEPEFGVAVTSLKDPSEWRWPWPGRCCVCGMTATEMMRFEFLQWLDARKYRSFRFQIPCCSMHQNGVKEDSSSRILPLNEEGTQIRFRSYAYWRDFASMNLRGASQASPDQIQGAAQSDVVNDLHEAQRVQVIEDSDRNNPRCQAGETRVSSRDGLTYVWIPPGRFEMGCSSGDRESYSNEKPSHSVTITRGFWIGQTPVTQAAYHRVIGRNPSYFPGLQRPVETINWHEAVEYCFAVGMRLPTEAEWEYAARAGSTKSRYGDLDSIAWYEGNSRGQTHDVAQKQPNTWNLYDMLGNVEEWVEDWYDKKFYTKSPSQDPRVLVPGTFQSRVLRGGSYWGGSYLVRASYRGNSPSISRYKIVGFRCVVETLA